MNDLFRLSYIVEPIEKVKFRKDVQAKQKCQDRDIIMGKTTNPSEPVFPQLQINSGLQNLPPDMVLRVSAVSERTTVENLVESLDNLEPHFNKMLQCRETNKSDWHMSKKLEPNQREIALEGLSLVKVTRGEQKGLSDSVVKLFFELLILKQDGSKQCVSWLLSNPIKDLGSDGGSIDVSLISIQSAPVSGGEMMMCFLAGPEMKFPQNSFELQVEFFEVDDEERKVWNSQHTITSNQLHKVGQSVAGFWFHVPKYDKGLRGKVAQIQEETSNTYFMVKKVSKKGHKVNAQSNRLQFTYTPLEPSRLKRKALDDLFPQNEYDPYMPFNPRLEPAALAQPVPLPNIPTTIGPDNKVIEEVLENSTVLSDIIDTIIKSPERNVELPLFESEANDQQIQVTVTEVDHPDLLRSSPGFNLQSPSSLQMPSISSPQMYGSSPGPSNPFSPQGNVNYSYGNTSPVPQNFGQANYGITSPMSRPGSVSPNFQQQGTSTTYVHQNVTSPQQSYGSMLSPPPPHSFQQNQQLQSNNSSSFAEQERSRSRSGGGQQLRVQLYPRRQRSEDPQVQKELEASDILGLSPQPQSFLLNNDPMFSPQPNSQYNNQTNWRNSNGGFFLSDGNDVIQVDSASKPSKNKSKLPDDSGKDNLKAAVKSDDKTVSESGKDKSNLSEDNPVINVEIVEDTNKESLDSLTDELKNMKVETAVKKDSSKTDVNKAKASLDEVTDNIDNIKLEPK